MQVRAERRVELASVAHPASTVPPERAASPVLQAQTGGRAQRESEASEGNLALQARPVSAVSPASADNRVSGGTLATSAHITVGLPPELLVVYGTRILTKNKQKNQQNVTVHTCADNILFAQDLLDRLVSKASVGPRDR